MEIKVVVLSVVIIALQAVFAIKVYRQFDDEPLKAGAISFSIIFFFNLIVGALYFLI